MRIYVLDDSMIGADQVNYIPWNITKDHGLYVYPSGKHPNTVLVPSRVITPIDTIRRQEGG